MNNDWLQISYANGDKELHNTDNLLYLLKNTDQQPTIRKLSFLRKFSPIILAAGDTVSSKTQQEVETFLGGPFVKLHLDNTTLFVPVKTLLQIKKVGSNVTVTLKQDFDETSGTLTLLGDIGPEFN